MSDNDFFGGRRRRRAGAAFSPYSLFANGEQGVWYDPSDLTPEKVSWRRNLLTYSQDFENAAWTKSNASILSNLALYSQDFDNAAWFKGTESTVTANTTTAPDGTTTADSMFETANTSAHGLSQSIAHSASINTTTQIRVKPNGRTRVSLYAGGSADLFGAVFDLVGSGSVVSDLTGGTATLTSRSIATLSDGWYLLTIVGVRGTNASSTPVLALHQGTGTPTTPAPSYTGDVTKGVFLWGAQFLPGSTAQTYTRSLATAAPIQFADPLGGTLADKLVENTANAVHLLQQTPSVTGGTTMTLSAYVKAAERTLARLDIAHGGVANYPTYFNLSNGTIASQSTGNTSTITALGDGWYRVTLSRVMGSTQTQAISQVGPSNADYGPNSTATYTGDGVSGILVYGAQVEQASTASAYQRITDFSSDFLAAFPTHALYQESTGTTPVTALGQSVGLVLDKRLGALTSLGAEATSGAWLNTHTTTFTTFSSTGPTGFAATTSGASNPRTRVDCTVPGAGWYIVEFTPTFTGGSFTTSGLAATASPYSPGIAITSPATSGVPFRSIIYATGTQGSFVLNWNALTASTLNVTGFTVKSFPGNHAIQATSASRPTLQARSNLLTYSEQADNAAWTKTGSATATPNTVTAPDGTMTADTVSLPTGGGTSQLYQVISSVNAPLTASMWIRADAPVEMQFGFYDGVLDVTTINVTTSWQRFTHTRTAGLTSADRRACWLYRGIAGASTVYVWGAQVEQSSAPTTYQRVTTATDYADVGLPRNLTFDGVDDSLATAGNVDFATWTVGSRRNLLTVPTMFDAAPWTLFRATITPNTATAPDGTLTADALFETAVTNTHIASRSSSAVSGAGTFSCYVKANGRTWCSMYTDFSGGLRTFFNLSNGTIGTSGHTSAAIVDAGNGWYRCSVVIADLSGAPREFGIESALSNGNSTQLGDPALGILLWGAQLETGSTATAFQDVGTDKVTVLSGVFKLSDAARGVVAELSATAGNPGTFYFSAPNTPGSGNYDFASGGSIPFQQATSPSSYPAPITNILTGLGDIGGDRAILRLNGSVAQTNTADQGTGNYGSYLLYIGRRASTSLPFNGRLFQLVIRGAATDSVTVGNAERWVGQLTGVNL